MTVPTSSLIAMGAAAAFCALLPIGILIWWRRTERTRLLPALWGALAFLLFARGLEMGLHYLCIHLRQCRFPRRPGAARGSICSTAR